MCRLAKGESRQPEVEEDPTQSLLARLATPEPDYELLSYMQYFEALGAARRASGADWEPVEFVNAPRSKPPAAPPPLASRRADLRAGPFTSGTASAASEARDAMENIAIITPRKSGDAGCKAANLAVRSMLGFDPGRIVVGDLLIIGKNNYEAQCVDGATTCAIYNGERCSVTECGPDFIDVAFPRNSEGRVREVRLLMANPDGDASAQLPEDVLFGYAMSTHKAQGSQFDYVIIMTERGYSKHGVIQGSNIYTAVSRARKKVFIIGDVSDFAHGAATPETPRMTLLDVQRAASDPRMIEQAKSQDAFRKALMGTPAPSRPKRLLDYLPDYLRDDGPRQKVVKGPKRRAESAVAGQSRAFRDSGLPGGAKARRSDKRAAEGKTLRSTEGKQLVEVEK